MLIDLRSDTVSKPTKEMLKCILGAKVGDDVFGDDDLTSRLQHQAAEMLGKDGKRSTKDWRRHMCGWQKKHGENTGKILSF